MKVTKEIKIALVGIVGLVTLFFGLNYLKGLNLFSIDSKYYLAFKEISGLSASCPIYADGYKVGVVKNISYDYQNANNIMVEIGVDPKLRIPKGSSAEIVGDLLGNVQVNLLLANNPRERVEVGQTIYGVINGGAMAQLKDMIPTVEKILPKLDSIMTSLNLLLADPAIAQSLHNVQNITSNLTTTTAEANRLMAQLNSQVPGMMSKANSVLNNTSELTAGLNQKLAEVDVATTMAKINQTLANVNAITEQMNSREGSLGLLLHDPGLYNHLNATMRDADSLLINLRAHPKRYVHFSLFGRKDK